MSPATLAAFVTRRLKSFLQAAALLLLCCGTIAQGGVPGSCAFIVPAQASEWRLAGAEEYSGAQWQAWSQQTGSATPWQAEGDFDGDGLRDRAQVYFHPSDQRWMMGVVFGIRPGENCRVQQIAMGRVGKDDEEPALRAVLTWPKGVSALPCHQVAGKEKSVCRAKPGTALARSKRDAFVLTDEAPTRVEVYLWGNPDNRKRMDGSPFMRFNQVEAYYDVSGTSHDPKAAYSPQPGDTVSASERTKLIAALDVAYDRLQTQSYRSIVEIREAKADGALLHSMEADFEPPNRIRVRSHDPGEAPSTILQIGDQVWQRVESGTWHATTRAWPLPAGQGAAIGTAVITGVRKETVGGSRRVTVQTRLQEYAVIERAMTLDVARGLLIRSVDTIGATVTKTTYDWNVRFAPIVPPGK